MNVLIFDPCMATDSIDRQRILEQFGSPDFRLRFAAGILDATWQTRDFCPDVIVIEGVGDCAQLRKLTAMLRRISPSVAVFHLDGGSIVATDARCRDAAAAAIPNWLRDMAMPWIFERPATAAAALAEAA